jgi:hypothetical protein
VYFLFKTKIHESTPRAHAQGQLQSPGAAAAATLLRQRASTLKGCLRLVLPLARPSMQPRHWTKLSARLSALPGTKTKTKEGVKLVYRDDALTLAKLLELGVHLHQVVWHDCARACMRAHGCEPMLLLR